MANKRRPKKTKPPYRRYGPGGSVTRTEGHSPGSFGEEGGDEDAEEEEDEEKEKDDKSDVMKNLTRAVQSIKLGDMAYIPITFSRQHSVPVLPVEIFDLVLKYTDKLYPQLLRVCKMFYRLYLPILYKQPRLNSRNFFQFVETISSSKSKKGQLVKILDLSTIIQSGKNSYVSKLLRRCAEKLDVFVAPQTSFGYAPLVSLRGCKNIRVLDLGLVSETVNLNELFHAIRNLKELTKLSFPRSSISCEQWQESFWPPNLWRLRLSGGISEQFLAESNFPNTITRLEFAHCPLIKEFPLYSMLNKYGENLTHLAVQYPMPGLKENSLDFLFTYCPNLLFLQIYVDYCSKFLFAEDLLPKLNGRERPLKTLWIDASGGLGQGSKLHPDDLTIAIMEDRLPCLKAVRITSKLGWDVHSDDVTDLASLLEERDGGLYVSYH